MTTKRILKIDCWKWDKKWIEKRRAEGEYSCRPFLILIKNLFKDTNLKQILKYHKFSVKLFALFPILVSTLSPSLEKYPVCYYSISNYPSIPSMMIKILDKKLYERSLASIPLPSSAVFIDDIIYKRLIVWIKISGKLNSLDQQGLRGVKNRNRFHFNACTFEHQTLKLCPKF